MAGLKISHALAGVLVGTLALSSSAKAANFSFSGSLSVEKPVQFFEFSISSSSEITLKTLSYAGGTQANGTVVPAGGFETVLGLYDTRSSPNTLIERDIGSFPPYVGTDPVTGEAWDTFLRTTLDPGNYTVTLSQRNSSPAFPETSIYEPGFSSSIEFPSVRTDNWALDFLNVDMANPIGPRAVTDVPPVAVPLSSL